MSRGGTITSYKYRVIEAGKLKIMREGTNCTAYVTNKIDKITIANLNACTKGVNLTIAFMNPDQDEATGVLATNKGVYIVKGMNIPLGGSVEFGNYIFDIVRTSTGTSNACTDEKWQLGIRADYPSGSECDEMGAENPGLDVFITQ